MTTGKTRKDGIKMISKEVIVGIKKAKKEGKGYYNFRHQNAAPELSIQLLRKGYKVWWRKGVISVSW